MPLVDTALYIEGRRSGSESAATSSAIAARTALTWVGLYRPTSAEFESVAEKFSLHPSIRREVLIDHRRSWLERFGQNLFVVIRTASCSGDDDVEFGELDLVLGPGFLISVGKVESPQLVQLRARLEASPARLSLGPEAVLYAILDEAVHDYRPVIARLEAIVDEMEDRLLDDDPTLIRQVYRALSTVVSFQRAVHPVNDMLDRLRGGVDKYEVAAPLREDLDDVVEHIARISDRADLLRVEIQSALEIHATAVNQRQNDEMRRISEASLAQNEDTRRLTEVSIAQNEGLKKISAWAAILFPPTLIATIYGMNFDVMPETHWALGYPFALALMAGTAVALFAVFRRKKWL